MENDHQLVRDAQNGSKKAFEKLYKQNFKKLYRFVRFKVDANEIAEDLVSESFIKAFENISKFKFKSSFKSWLYQIAKNLVYDYYAEKKKSGDNEIIDRSSSIEEEAEVDPTLERKVKSILKNLQENYRQVLELRFLFKYSVKETAEIMKTTEANIKVMQHRALKKAQSIKI